MAGYKDESVRGMLQNGRFEMKVPRTHQNCKEVYKVARPGKTESDRRNKKSS